LLGQPRGSSVFAAPCRAALSAKNYREANAINLQETGRGLSQQAWGVIPKIKHADDAITSDCQQWAFEVHPEVCFWALNERCPMSYNKKTKEGGPAAGGENVEKADNPRKRSGRLSWKD
jgi:predicted RNase H-like nuclease